MCVGRRRCFVRSVMCWSGHGLYLTKHYNFKCGVEIVSFRFQSKQAPSCVIPNTSAVLADFQTIGEGLVKKIEVLNAWTEQRLAKRLTHK